MDELMHFRAKANEVLDVKTSVNDWVIKACAGALVEVPVCNSQWFDGHIRQYAHADVSVAVNTEHGLLTPIVFGADTLSISEISKDVKRLAAKTIPQRAGDVLVLRPEVWRRRRAHRAAAQTRTLVCVVVREGDADGCAEVGTARRPRGELYKLRRA